MDTSGQDLQAHYAQRTSRRWKDRLRRLIEPPLPLVMNPAEPKDYPLGRWNLYVGGAGRSVPGYVNLDIFAVPGVTVCGNVEGLPFPSGMFERVECDAVLEHVRDPIAAMREMARVTAAGGYIHMVTPFCHPFHEYPKDYRRFSIDGLKELAGPLEVVAAGWRTGPTATLLIAIIEYVKLLVPWRVWRGFVHVALGWTLFPLRYMDLILLRRPDAGRLGNHCYIWLRKPGPS